MVEAEGGHDVVLDFGSCESVRLKVVLVPNLYQPLGNLLGQDMLGITLMRTQGEKRVKIAVMYACFGSRLWQEH